MRMPSSFHYAAGIAGIAAMLAGCSSGGSSTNLTTGLDRGGLAPSDAVVPKGFNPAAARAQYHPHRLWISPDVAKSKLRLLFVTDANTNTVNVFSMPDLKLQGQVGGFTFPDEECAGPNGQVWVVDYFRANVTRWSRTLEKTGELDDNYGTPDSCAFDATTGNLAVSNFVGPSGPGNVVIFAHARGSGTPVSNPQEYDYNELGYDSSGNLWVDGFTAPVSGKPIVSSCSASSCSTVTITGGTIYRPGFLQWVEGLDSWYIADSSCGGSPPFDSCIYPVSASGKLGAPITLSDPEGNIVCGGALTQAAITSKGRVLAAGIANADCGGFTGVARWNFPAGGTPTDSNRGNLYTPVGAAISAK